MLTPAREAELRERARRNAVHGHWRVMLPARDLADLLYEIDRLRALTLAMADRVAGQSEALGSRAERDDPLLTEQEV